MIETVLTLCLLGLGAAAPEIRVLDGPEVQPLCDALKRSGCPMRRLDRLDAAALAGPCVLVLSGKAPPAAEAEAKLIRSFVEAGGAVLAIGGGATWMIDHGLFDARGYYLSGTTIHMSGFHGYHRLTFGYPGPKPEDGWTAGVPMLLRATEGPLMELGPRATSVLGAGGPYSLAAFQRLGGGLMLLIGPDPQGGGAYYTLDRPSPTPGDKLKTDRFLANAVAFLQDPDCNLIPNAGFEENMDLPPQQSNWQLDLGKGATATWSKQDAPEGKVFLRIVCPARSSGSVRPFCPIAVERGSTYRLSCLYRATAPWNLGIRLLDGVKREPLEPRPPPPIRAAECKQWQRIESLVSVPVEAAYASLLATLPGPGELELDDFTLHRMPASQSPPPR